MNEIMQQGIFTLLHSAITGQVKTLPEGFSLEQVMPLIKFHQLGNLIYYGAANCGILPKTPEMKELFTFTYRSMVADERQRAEVKRVMEAFEQNQIQYMPVKGVLMKALYPKTDMRLMGDADILIKMEQYDRVSQVLEQMGYEFIKETDHEMVWNHPQLHLELHKRLIPGYNVDFARYYGDCWHLGKPVEGNPYRYEMTVEDHMIYLFLHFSKHYRNGGIGIRHMVDLYVYRRANPDMDQSYIARELEKMQMYRFYCNIFKTLDCWFDGGQADQVTELITQRILLSGVYGTSSGREIFDAVRNKTTSGTSARKIQRKRWFHILFPSYSGMCQLYPVLTKAPVLLPVMWVVRWAHVLITKPKAILKQRDRVRKLDADKLETWEGQMNAVGLTLDFGEDEE